MSKSASMDIESDVNWNEFENAVNQASKEATSRYDFKGSTANIEYNKVDKFVKLSAENEMKLSALESILATKLAGRGVDSRCLKGEKIETASHKEVRQKFTISSGLSKDDAREIVKKIKEFDPKSQASINDTKIKVTGKGRDELQAVRQFLMENVKNVALQFTNFKS
jgi:uncharacterized protein YajQ (UPF0234 family)